MSLSTFIAAYIECALWSSTYLADSDGNPVDEEGPGTRDIPMDESYSPEDLAPEALVKMTEDCKAFIRDHIDPLIESAGSGWYRDAAQLAHDFWLTRNHHGAGFWDGDYPEGIGETLTEASHGYGSVDLYIGDDGLVYHS